VATLRIVERLSQLTVALVLAASTAIANPAHALRFETISNEKGLSENTVKAIVEDQQGFLWFGTERGLNRFDGLEFKVFSAGRDIAHELSEDHINTLFVDRSGILWIGTFGGGLSRYDPHTAGFTNYLHDARDAATLSSNDVSAIWQDAAGSIWIGTHGGGLDRLDAATGVLSHVPLAGAGRGAADQVAAISGDGTGTLWVGTLGAGLLHLDAAGHPAMPRDRDIGTALGDDITALLLDSRNVLWIGTRGNGLARRDPDGSLQIFRHDAASATSLAHDTINRLYEDQDHQIWIATAQGLDQFDAEHVQFVHNRHDPSDESTLPYNDVFAVLQDSLGTLWAGTGGGGAARHVPSGKQFTLLEHDSADPRGANSGGVWSVLEDAHGTVWIGTLDGGLQILAPSTGHFASYRGPSGSPPALSDNDIRALVEGDAGQLWIGTRHGLNLLDSASGTVKHFLHDTSRADSLSDDYIRPLLLAPSGTLWVGTYGGGLDRLEANSDRFAHYRHDAARADSLSDDRVYCLLQDNRGALWVGTHGGGLNRLDAATNRFARFAHDPRDPRSLGNDRVLSLHEDRHGTLWVGTGAGLDRFDAVTAQFAHQDALRHNLVYAIAEDDVGRFWMSTDDGIVKFDPVSGQVRRYPMGELWGNSEFNGGAWHRGASGRIYFGGVSGIVMVTPQSTPDPLDGGVPMLTDFMLFNHSVNEVALDPKSPLQQPIEFADRIVLTHEDTVFGFAFAALRSAHPERRVFSYRLEGFDDRWLETRARKREATYTGVPAGEYRFRVRTTDADGAWSPTEASVGVTIRPAPWKSGPAYAAYAALAAAALAYLAWLRNRRRAVKRQARLALQKSEERLSLALWGSGDELLDWNLEDGTMLRQGGESGRETHAAGGLRDIEALAPLVHPEDFPALRQALQQHFAGLSSTLEVSYRARTRNGRWPWKLIRGRVVARDANGRPLRFSGMQKDISRIKAVESELRELNEALDERVRERSRELEERQTELIEAEKMASLGRLVAGVAHEVNTPLGISVTAVSMFRDQIGNIRNTLLHHLQADEVDRVMQQMEQARDITEKNLQRAANLIRTFKQVAVDQINPEFRSVLVREYLEHTLQSLHSHLKTAGHRVEISCDPQIKMVGRPDAVYQVVVNLVMNSILHAFADGTTGTIKIEVERDGSQLRLNYADDGVGMSPEVARRVFEPFFTTRRNSGGTGLGMHIVYNLVTQALAGRITCTTAPGEGVRFVITFPQVHPHSV
jgi:ligand-binding sensor domain-containing protein/signal transduction histidine kinase